MCMSTESCSVLFTFYFSAYVRVFVYLQLNYIANKGWRSWLIEALRSEQFTIVTETQRILAKLTFRSFNSTSRDKAVSVW